MTPMMLHAKSLEPPEPRRTPRSLMLVGHKPDDRVLDTIVEAGAYDVILIEPTATAYSRIKRAVPSLVVLCMADDDIEACQVMSMLKLDSDTSAIPVLTCLLEGAPAQA
jgi:hypothetical protein